MNTDVTKQKPIHRITVVKPLYSFHGSCFHQQVDCDDT